MKQTMFIVPYWTYSIKNWSQIKKKIKPLLKQYRCVSAKNQNFLSNRAKTSAGFIQEVGNIFKDPLKEFVQEVKHNLQITAAWATSYKKGMDHILHSHSKCLFTGILYVDFDPRLHQATTFKQPFNQFDSGNVCFTFPKVKEGDMLLCPSNIEHYGPVNTSTTIKTIIGFDLY
tara:strand:- start:151 stop:669 length:519 start_codon:yes stop_codon:yes gene_type:complete